MSVQYPVYGNSGINQQQAAQLLKQAPKQAIKQNNSIFNGYMSTPQFSGDTYTAVAAPQEVAAIPAEQSKQSSGYPFGALSKTNKDYAQLANQKIDYTNNIFTATA